METTRLPDSRNRFTFYRHYVVKNFDDMHEAAEYLIGHPIWTHQFANAELIATYGELFPAQFLACRWTQLGSVDASNWQIMSSNLKPNLVR
jgi:hypothetical protein